MQDKSFIRWLLLEAEDPKFWRQSIVTNESSHDRKNQIFKESHLSYQKKLHPIDHYITRFFKLFFVSKRESNWLNSIERQKNFINWRYIYIHVHKKKSKKIAAGTENKNYMWTINDFCFVFFDLFELDFVSGFGIWLFFVGITNW